MRITREIEPSISIGDFQAAAIARLHPYSESPSLDIQVMIAHILDQTRTWVLTHPEFEPDPSQIELLEIALQTLISGYPLPYLIGEWEFFGLPLVVTPDVLIPRPETELLVEAGLEWLRDHPDARWGLDLGTGSGCIAVALASSVPDLHFLATDRSFLALRIAAQNFKRYGLFTRVTPVQTDLFNGLSSSKKFNIIAANPPYIPTDILRGLKIYQREPELALDGGCDGLAILRPLISKVGSFIADPGLILIEINAPDAPAVFDLAADTFPDGHVEILPDLAGLPRLLKIIPEQAAPLDLSRKRSEDSLDGKRTIIE